MRREAAQSDAFTCVMLLMITGHSPAAHARHHTCTTPQAYMLANIDWDSSKGL